MPVKSVASISEFNFFKCNPNTYKLYVFSICVDDNEKIILFSLNFELKNSTYFDTLLRHAF